ncbi:MAG: hypothetical protein IJ690_01555 [Clostridia bacterium]|nr:hypothetical protein [Clostridia bacterium]MBR1653628.1 hypothetical protein [Clostridia bacterium]
MDEKYQKVAYIGLRNPDGSYLTNVPLYVKVNELNANGLTDMQEELIHRISSIMLQRYQQQFSEFFGKKKADKLLKENLEKEEK